MVRLALVPDAQNAEGEIPLARESARAG